jgi:CRP/FNR family cyclic AMP-dependent transcriptional regulator
MDAGDLAGWLAASLTLISFSMRSMMALRIAAIAANVCFILYGTANGLYPVVVLHILLLPCNFLRLYELRREKW